MSKQGKSGKSKYFRRPGHRKISAIYRITSGRDHGGRKQKESAIGKGRLRS